ncbi:CMGC family protein kinase [Trichomonas vaginalis G3]|uniref:non-specific serine/threonine protein kinase n=1 Tax=Trichomonas vaginalis (strain ATCC PRA-98 / G3) TaxID=412133 RepID=A2EVW5_TRIV3|nr:STKc CK2 alpha domain-containing protein [Trichomonas vaginalis G3]EAY03186.1 CMGC family protein kinase [Trichomonas vaginalis G3]KAI5520327.1 STKc CK2 alpha domain-containing protein [Trichomonas vaginalis G3]|eukprot:XP_001315409.1 CMGC family protein kinase [Trichomonas vaginalis G3]
MKPEGPKYRIITVSRIYADVNTPEEIQKETDESSDFKFSTPDNYELIKPLGSGKYSVVFLGCMNGKTKVAIKILKSIPLYKVYREIAILKKVSSVPNVVGFTDAIKDEQSRTISIVTEYFDNVAFKSLGPVISMNDIRNIMYSLLQSLDCCHSKGIMHRDIKPGNILVHQNKAQICIIDWGLSDYYLAHQQYSCRVSTLRYKAPELLLNYQYYDYGIDVWGAGCVFAELLFKYPFFEGKTVDEMIASVAGLCGMDSIINYVEKYGLSVPEGAMALFPSNQKANWNWYFSMCRQAKKDENAFDLIQKLLTVDHNERITAHEALEHPFFDSIRGKK